MVSLDEAPASIRGWFAAEKSPDRAQALRAILSPEVVMDFGGRKIRGVDAVVGTIMAVMPPGWIGAVEWNLLPRSADGRLIARASGSDGAPVQAFVPGAPAQSMEAMDLIFTLGSDGSIVGLAGKAHHFSEPADVAPAMRSGDVPTAFVLPDVNGIEVSLSQERAAATVVVFTSNHCPFSLAWHDRLQRVARDYAPRRVRFLNVSPNDPVQGPNDSLERARDVVAEGRFAGAFLFDRGQVVARRWGARRTPEVFVLDAQGILRYHGAPDADSADESLNAGWVRGALDRILSGTVPDPADTPPVGCPIKWTR